jgi:LPS sulfotransferase NodH
MSAAKRAVSGTARKANVSERGSLPHASVLIATLPRSGSWLLAEGLERSGVCGHPREYFRADYQPRYTRAWGLFAGISPLEYVNAVLQAGTTSNGVFAAKFHWGQLSHLVGQLAGRENADPSSEIERINAAFPNPRWVYLFRQDKSRQAVSLRRAVKSDVWWRLDDSVERNVPYDEGDLAETRKLESALTEHEASWQAFFQSSAIEPLVIDYEDLTRQYERTLRWLLGALGLPVPRAVPAPRLRKQSGVDTERWLSAYLTYRDRLGSHSVPV